MSKKKLLEKIEDLEDTVRKLTDNFSLVLKHLELEIYVEKHIQEPCPHENLRAFLSGQQRPQDRIVREYKVRSTKQEVAPAVEERGTMEGRIKSKK